MHLKPDTQLLDFLSQIKKCSSEVYFETSEGDCLALRSSLSQYIFCSLANQPSLLQSGTIRPESKKDLPLLEEFLE